MLVEEVTSRSERSRKKLIATLLFAKRGDELTPPVGLFLATAASAWAQSVRQDLKQKHRPP